MWSCCIWIFPRTVAAVRICFHGGLFSPRQVPFKSCEKTIPRSNVSSSLPSLPRLQFKGDKLAWGSKERSEGDHDFWQWHPRGCCERQTGRVFEICTFSSDAVTFHNFEHLTFPSLSFPSFLTYWIVSKKVSFYTNTPSTRILHFANNWRGFGAMVRGPRFIYLEELAELVFETTSQEATTGASFFLGRFRSMWLYVSKEAKPSVFFVHLALNWLRMLGVAFAHVAESLQAKYIITCFSLITSHYNIVFVFFEVLRSLHWHMEIYFENLIRKSTWGY